MIVLVPVTYINVHFKFQFSFYDLKVYVVHDSCSQELSGSKGFPVPTQHFASVKSSFFIMAFIIACIYLYILLTAMIHWQLRFTIMTE